MGVGAEYALYNCLVAIAIRAPFLVIVEAVFAGCDYERIQNILLHHYACTRVLEFLKKRHYMGENNSHWRRHSVLFKGRGRTRPL